MWLVSVAMEYAAPLFLVISPILSYADQIYSIQRTKSSAGFSLDIPLIMLVASIFKVFYWFGAYYSFPLLLQAMMMIGVQILLLKVALDHRPQSPVDHTPFSGQLPGGHSELRRPYDFWQWKATRPYWTFLAYLGLSLFLIHVLIPPISNSEFYITLLGFAGLGVEAFLPVPQVLANQRSKSCKGFRLSVLTAWLLGDAMKLSYFFYNGSSVPWAFRVCGMLQCVCDCYLGVQYWMFGHGQLSRVEKASAANSGDGVDGWGMKDIDVRLS
ncbi:hypothetical protein D8B26_006205 [Coccidioides posadasii str. Silveira]|uniref:PQ loop repeat protein n=1 Tax=Coccidioides posadasii (strain RMSCC 757 / Silveira) TaxID=443226 RepID=E9DBB6_COCPS|nr:PQ loop repeat protein [Coccidioides posadasii str. Silveira]QVM11558.1 hypothetical protein D8B26_006205 [Coccidioides posadasii str. Silveira]